MPLNEDVNRLLNRVPKDNLQIVKLPCGCASVEVTKTGDQWLKCPKCQKSFLLIWSQINKRFKHE